MRQEEECLPTIDDSGNGIELDDFKKIKSDNNEYTDIIQRIENRGNDLTNRIKQNMKQLSKKV